MNWANASEELCDLATEVGEMRAQYGTTGADVDIDKWMATEKAYAELFNAEEHAQLAADADDVNEPGDGEAALADTDWCDHSPAGDSSEDGYSQTDGDAEVA